MTTLTETMAKYRNTLLNEGKKKDEKDKKNVKESTLKESVHHALEAILQKYSKDVDLFIEGEQLIYLSKEFQYALYEYYAPDMPYGTAKARTGDPDEFIEEHLMDYLSREGLLPQDEVDVPSSITDPVDDGSNDPLYGTRMDSADMGEVAPLGESKSSDWKNERFKGCKCPTSKKVNPNCSIHGVKDSKKKNVKESIPGPFSKKGSIAKKLAEGKDKKDKKTKIVHGENCSGCGGPIPYRTSTTKGKKIFCKDCFGRKDKK